MGAAVVVGLANLRRPRRDSSRLGALAGTDACCSAAREELFSAECRWSPCPVGSAARRAGELALLFAAAHSDDGVSPLALAKIGLAGCSRGAFFTTGD